MKACPIEINGAIVCCYAVIVEDAPYEHRLAIARYENEPDYKLFYCDEDWQVLVDSTYATLGKAKRQAESQTRFLFDWVNHESPDEVEQRMIEELAAARESMDLTPVDIAERTRLDETHYRDVEGYPGDIFLTVNLHELLNLLRLLDLPVRHFLRGLHSSGIPVTSVNEYVTHLRPHVQGDFEDRAGWNVTPVLTDPASLWDWCLKELIDVSKATGIDWLTFLEHAPQDL